MMLSDKVTSPSAFKKIKIAPARVLITGICGFIGHHLAEHVLKNTDWEIVGIDNLSYSSWGFKRLRDVDCYDNERVCLFTHDISTEFPEMLINEIGDITYLLHLAAESHVDRSIVDARPFVRANVMGTVNVLDLARKIGVQKMNYFSTDEVFGPAPQGIFFKEWDAYGSGNPYAATKAAGEEMCLAYANTHKVPVFITHTMNVFGERQHPEKFIPKVIKSVLNGETVPIHASPDGKAGSRFYIHARNVADALLFLLDRAEAGEKYNIVGEIEVDNLTLAQKIAGVIGRPLKYELVDFHSSRPGHDLRYSLDGSKLLGMGWCIPKNFDDSLVKTIQWTLSRKGWLDV